MAFRGPQRITRRFLDVSPLHVCSLLMIRSLLSLLLAATPLFGAWEVVPEEGRVSVLENGEPLTAFHAGRVPHVFPLPSPSGANLARNYPIVKGVDGEDTDHPHHQSLWLTHGAVNGFDFWSWKGEGEPRIDHVKTSDVEVDDLSASFTVELEWIADNTTLLTEARRFEFSRPNPEMLTISVTSKLTAALDEILLGDTKEGTFAVRVDRSLRMNGPLAKGQMADSEGRTNADIWGKRASWVAFHGPDEKGEPAVIAILEHPSSFRHPTWWHARGYGLLSANPFGIHEFEGKDDKSLGNFVLQKGDNVQLRYQVVIYHGSLADANLPAVWKTFANLKNQ